MGGHIRGQRPAYLETADKVLLLLGSLYYAHKAQKAPPAYMSLDGHHTLLLSVSKIVRVVPLNSTFSAVQLHVVLCR